MGAVEHLKTLCCLGLPPESAMIALTPLLHEIIPHGWTRMVLIEPDACAIAPAQRPPLHCRRCKAARPAAALARARVPAIEFMSCVPG